MGAPVLLPSSPLRAGLLLALALVAAPGASQTLGEATGRAWLGRPFEVNVALRFDAAEPGDSCLHADVFFGSRRINAEAGYQRRGDAAQLRVATTQAVNDPAVRLVVRAGCGSVVSRQYTFLAEPMPMEPGVTVLPGPAQAEPAVVAAAVARPAEPPGPSMPAVRTAPPVPRTAPPAAVPATPVVSRPVVMPAVPVRTASPAAVVVPSPGLRSTTWLYAPDGEPAQRAAAAALWRALQQRPEDSLRQLEVLQKLDRDFNALRQQRDQLEGEVKHVRGELQARRDAAQRAPALDTRLAVAAGGGVAAGFVLALLMPRRRKAAAARPHATEMPPSSGASEQESEWASTVAMTPPARAPGEPPTLRARVAPLAEAGAVVQIPDFTAPLLPLPGAAAAPVAGSRTRELAELLHEAGFLCDIELHDEARRALQEHVRSTTRPSVLAFYELMALCRHTRDERAFASARRRFEEVYRVPPPSLDVLSATEGIEAHPRWAGRLVAGWPSAGLRDLLEQRLFSAPVEEDLRLSRSAWADLLCLHGVLVAMGPALEPAADTARA